MLWAAAEFRDQVRATAVEPVTQAKFARTFNMRCSLNTSEGAI